MSSSHSSSTTASQFQPNLQPARVLFSADAQRAVLGSVLHDNTLMEVVQLVPDDFSGWVDQTIYAAMLERWEAKQPFDVDIVALDLEDRGALERVGGRVYIEDAWAGAVPDRGIVAMHVKQIKRFSNLRKAAVLGDTLLREAEMLGTQPEDLAAKIRPVLESIEAAGSPVYESDGMVCLRDVQPVDIQWLWANHIPLGTVTVFDGDPGLGKSLLTLDIAARVTTGTAMPDGSPSVTGGVIILTSEDALANTIRPRLDAAGADVSKVFAFDPETDVAPLTFPNDVSRLEEMIATYDTKLVVVDPLVAYLGTRIDSHRDQDVRSALAPLVRMAERTGVAVVGIRHLNKASGTSPIYRGGGSIAIIGAARASFLVAKDPEDPDTRVFAPNKCNLAPDGLASRQFGVIAITGPTGEVPKIAWRGTSDRSARELLAQPQDEDERSATDDAVEFLRDALRDGPRPVKEVKASAAAAGIAWRTIERVKRTAAVESRKSDFDGVWVLELRSPPSMPDSLQHKNLAVLADLAVLAKNQQVTDTDSPTNSEERQHTILAVFDGKNVSSPQPRLPIVVEGVGRLVEGI
jgi:hypothetical protein